MSENKTTEHIGELFDINVLGLRRKPRQKQTSKTSGACSLQTALQHQAE